MKPELERKQWIGIVGIIGVLAGITLVPMFLQEFYGISAVDTLFVIIIVYFLGSRYLKHNVNS